MSASPVQPPRLEALRYVQPLREGGSLPAVVDTDGGLYVVKFRGAGQGPRALAAELIVGLLARAAGLPVPDLALVQVPEQFGKAEPDPEIRELLRASHGVNVGLRYLDGAFNYDVHAAGDLIDAQLAADVVWLDGFVTNPDRTHGNPNLLIWRRSPWLIDHGSALYIHHRWPASADVRGDSAFPPIRSHVLLARAGDVEAAHARMSERLDAALIEATIALVPDALLGGGETTPAEERELYVRYLVARLEAGRFVSDAIEAQRAQASAPRVRRTARR
ncbi:MAG TPA: HipA family kinase [Longimicrobiales bacterium]